MSQMGQLRDIVATFAPNTAAEMKDKADKKPADAKPADAKPAPDIDTADEAEVLDVHDDVDSADADETADTKSSS
jgi:hypothetical protein